MLRTLPIIALLISIALSGVGKPVQANRDDVTVGKPNSDLPSADLPSSTIAHLIDQLGDEQYLNRRSAELRLIELGSAAYDQLQLAENHVDLEIATRARYILRRIRIDWIRPEDPAEVQAILQNYGTISYDERLKRIATLKKLSNQEGWQALCRIARYDRSPLLARTAALEILKSKIEPSAQKLSEMLSSELEGSHRLPARWIQLYLRQLNQPDSLSEEWLTFRDREIELFEQESSDTSEAIVINFIKFHLDLCDKYSQSAQAFHSIQRWVDLLINQDGRTNESLVPAMHWILDNQQWDTLALVEGFYAKKIRDSRLLLYLSSMARSKQGKETEAESFADQAFQKVGDDPSERFLVATIIENMGRHDLAEREWKYLVENLPIFDETSARARENLALLRLHDRGDDIAAADLMDEFCKEVEEDPSKLRNDNTLAYFYQHFGDQRSYFLACHAEKLGDYSKQRQLLAAAAKADESNPDYLISMYHVKEASEEYREETRKRIRHMSNQLERDLKNQPNRAQSYNHWAWLISNTEGDYKKAVKYSLRSLELNPDNPSLLDTLGRCYYATGDLENAVKYQRQAVEGHPHLMVMQRQLDLFERELAKRK